MSSFLLLAPLLAQLGQVGPMVSPGAAPGISQPPLRQPGARRRHAPPPAAVAAPEPTRLGTCLTQAADDPDTAEDAAQAWLKEVTGSAQAEPLLCLGTAQAAQENWVDAEASFLRGRDLAAASDRLLLARLGAMAGNAALARGAPERALPALTRAHDDAKAAGEPQLAGDIAVDRARALVALKRSGDAAAALAEARETSPGNAQAWLLSATLSRRTDKLGDARTQIQRAADLAPLDADVGLEAGVIEVLTGRDAAARLSWESVLKAAPGTPQASTAQQYLNQLAATTAAAPPAASPAAAEPAPSTPARRTN
jgi:tetratricopeptide (TPR) repeat protein